jgi:Polyketide cyclase / dehydrase and lipid transport
MKPQISTASKIINAPADIVYRLIADYQNGHPHILPKPYFLSMDVEEGGYGAGTIVNFEMRLLGQRQAFHSRITEPEPGRKLVETDLRSGIPTSFDVLPTEHEHESEVTISTELKGIHPIQSLVAKMLLQKVYREELELLAQAAEERMGFAQPLLAQNDND